MKKKYNFVLLPPEGFHISLDWPLYKLRIWFQSVVSIIDQYKDQDQICLIKYRSKNQNLFFPINTSDSVVDDSCGSFLEYCNQETIVIGPLGSACIEALKNNVRYYSYDPLPCPSENKAYFNQLNQLLYTAQDKDELLENLKKEQIYRYGYSKCNLLYKDGMYLNQIVKLILNDERH